MIIIISRQAYGQSKLANILFSNELARRCAAAGNGVTSNALHPGMIRTDLARHLEEKISSGNTGSRLLSQALELGLQWVFSGAMDPDMGALTQVRVKYSARLFQSCTHTLSGSL